MGSSPHRGSQIRDHRKSLSLLRLPAGAGHRHRRVAAFRRAAYRILRSDEHRRVAGQRDRQQARLGIFADFVLEARVQSNIVTYSNAALLDANQEHRALWMRGSLEQVINTGGAQLVFGFSAQILDNKFLGPGRSALVEIARSEVSPIISSDASNGCSLTTIFAGI